MTSSIHELKRKLEDLLYEIEEKRADFTDYLKKSELTINTIKNQLITIDQYLQEEKEEEDDEEEEDEEDDESEDGEDRIFANMDPNLARLLGMEVKEEETKSDWVPPSFSGLQNSSRNHFYDQQRK